MGEDGDVSEGGFLKRYIQVNEKQWAKSEKGEMLLGAH